MAAIALGAAGNVIAPGIGGVIGALLGGYIDQYIIYPALFGEDEVAEIGRLSANAADEGAPGVYGYGAQLRVTGSLIMAGDPYDVQTSGSDKRGSVTTTTWYGDAVYAFTFNPIARFDGINFDVDRVWTNAAANAISVTLPYSGGSPNSGFQLYEDPQNSLQVWSKTGVGTYFLSHWHLTIENTVSAVFGYPVAWPELATFQRGVNVTGERFVTAGAINPLKLNISTAPGPTTTPVVESRTVGFITENGVTEAHTRLVIDMIAARYVGGLSVYTFASSQPTPGNATLDDLTVSTHWAGVPWPGSTDYVKFTQSIANDAKALSVSDSEFGFIGTNTPQLSSVYTEYSGSLRVPALPGVSFVGLSRINYSRKGNRLPQATAFIREADRTVSEIARIIISTHGRIPTGEVNTNLLDDDTCYGLAWSGVTQPSEPLRTLAMGFGFQTAEYNGAVRLISQANRATVEVDTRHLAAHPRSSAPGSVVEKTGSKTDPSPRHLYLRFHDIGNALQWGSVKESRDSVGSSSEISRQVSLAMSMDSLQATAAAYRLLKDAQQYREDGAVRLPYWYLIVTEGDVLDLTGQLLEAGGRSSSSGGTEAGATSRYMSVHGLDVGVSHYVEASGPVLSDAPGTPSGAASFVRSASTGGELAGEGTTSPDLAAPALLVAMELPALRDKDASQAGAYLAYSPIGTWAAGSGYRIWRNVDGGTTWENVGGADTPSVMGTLIYPLTGDAASDGVTDASQPLYVRLFSGDRGPNAFASVTEDQLNAGKNLIAVGSADGWELVQYRDAEEVTTGVVGTRVWKLTGLRRGVLGTEAAMGSHLVGTNWVVVIDRDRLHHYPVDISQIGTDLQLKCATEDQDIDTVPACLWTVEGRTSKSQPVTSLKAVRKSDGTVTFSWKRRSRIRTRNLGPTDTPLPEVTESYDIVIDPSGVNRTINTASTSEDYTPAMQTDDSLSGSEFTAWVYQRDSVRGRGVGASIFVPRTPGAIQDDAAASITDHIGNPIYH